MSNIETKIVFSVFNFHADGSQANK